MTTTICLFNRNLTMFGDDTWLRLFPGSFIRSDGTTSFFVSDYTEASEQGFIIITSSIYYQVFDF